MPISPLSIWTVAVSLRSINTILLVGYCLFAFLIISCTSSPMFWRVKLYFATGYSNLSKNSNNSDRLILHFPCVTSALYQILPSSSCSDSLFPDLSISSFKFLSLVHLLNAESPTAPFSLSPSRLRISPAEGFVRALSATPAPARPSSSNPAIGLIVLRMLCIQNRPDFWNRIDQELHGEPSAGGRSHEGDRLSVSFSALWKDYEQTVVEFG